MGSSGWPDVSWGPVLALGDHFGARELYEKGYSTVVEYRAAMVRGKRFGGIKPEKRLVEETQEAALSMKAVDLEIDFSKKPTFDMKFSSVTAPVGASAPMKKVKVCENPHIPKIADEVISEGLKARDAAVEMYSKGLDNYYITNVLSVGKLGVEENRVMVPTRWSITATDDMLGKYLMEEVRNYETLNKVWVFSHESYSNHYEIIVAPGAWEFENFEAWAPGSIWNPATPGGDYASQARISEEYEGHFGRTKYADKQVGAYYAVRLAALEFLSNIRRQARVIAIREVYEGYQVPVGVFQVRENVRDAMKNHQMFSTLEEALGEVGKRLRIPISEYKKKSRIIGQRSIAEFF